MLLDDELSLRVAYHADENMMFMNPDAVSAELRRQCAAKHELYQNDELLQKRLKRVADKQAEQTETFKFIRDPQNKIKRRMGEITYFRLYRHHYCVPELIALAEDAALEEPLRVAAIEALGLVRPFIPASRNFRHVRTIASGRTARRNYRRGPAHIQQADGLLMQPETMNDEGFSELHLKSLRH